MDQESTLDGGDSKRKVAEKAECQGAGPERVVEVYCN
jgi:hypothetical protein